jgi:hypothetical protein
MSTVAVKDWAALALVILALGMTLIEVLVAGDASAQRGTRESRPPEEPGPAHSLPSRGTPAVPRPGRSEPKKEEK